MTDKDSAGQKTNNLTFDATNPRIPLLAGNEIIMDLDGSGSDTFSLIYRTTEVEEKSKPLASRKP
jgi:hypothetical protein